MYERNDIFYVYNKVVFLVTICDNYKYTRDTSL